MPVLVFRARVPQLIASFTPEQSLWGERVDFLNLGCSLGDAGALTREAVEAALARLQRSAASMQEAINSLAGELAGGQVRGGSCDIRRLSAAICEIDGVISSVAAWVGVMSRRADGGRGWRGGGRGAHPRLL